MALATQTSLECTAGHSKMKHFLPVIYWDLYLILVAVWILVLSLLPSKRVCPMYTIYFTKLRKSGSPGAIRAGRIHIRPTWLLNSTRLKERCPRQFTAPGLKAILPEYDDSESEDDGSEDDSSCQS